LFGELVKMMAASGFGEEPSLETTFADIEQYFATGAGAP